MSFPMNFICPHCGMLQIATSDATATFFSDVQVGDFAEMRLNGTSIGFLRAETHVVRCANIACMRVTVGTSLLTSRIASGNQRRVDGTEFFSGRIYPPPCGKPFPVGVPSAMLEDYNEAWAIIELSPKSSATLARRCLQAMIRDFCGITKRSLYHEIEELEKQLDADTLPKGVEPETVQAMKVLKDKGNIGAHMTEVDGKIVEVDSGEAAQLLELIEMLFTDWYVARHKRQERLKAIESLGDSTS